jgi:hypothetical protein
MTGLYSARNKLFASYVRERLEKTSFISEHELQFDYCAAALACSEKWEHPGAGGIDEYQYSPSDFTFLRHKAPGGKTLTTDCIISQDSRYMLPRTGTKKIAAGLGIHARREPVDAVSFITARGAALKVLRHTVFNSITEFLLDVPAKNRLAVIMANLGNARQPDPSDSLFLLELNTPVLFGEEIAPVKIEQDYYSRFIPDDGPEEGHEIILAVYSL